MRDYNETLDSFKELAPDWDSYGARSIDGDAIEATRILTKAIQTGTASIVPLASGGCQIEVHKSGWDIEIEVDADKKEIAGFWEKRSN